MAQQPNEARARGKSRLYWLFVAAFIFATSAIFYSNVGVLQSLQNIVFDSYQRVFPQPASPSSAVRIVDVDEASIARLGQWPWPRSTMAQLTNNLGALHAKAIAFDISFSEPDRTSPEQMINWVDPSRRQALRALVSGWTTHDGVFADALAHNPTVLGATLQDDTPRDDFPQKAGVAIVGGNPARSLYAFTGYTGNLVPLTEAAQGIGSMNWVPDRDQVLRHVPLLFAQGSGIAPSLALEALRVADAQSTYVVRSTNPRGGGGTTRVQQVRVGERAIDTDDRGAIWLHFRRSNPSAYIPAWQVVSGQVQESQIRGKIILVGVSAAGLLDLRATPLDASIAGVEIHQQAIEQMLNGSYLSRPDFARGLEFSTAVLAVLLLAFAVPRLSASQGALLASGIVIAIIAVGILAFWRGSYLFDPVFPVGCVALFASGSSLYLFQRTEQQRAEIRRAFGQYVSPSVVRQLAANPEALKLGGEVRDLSLMFCDVRNFTGISESLNAQELTAFINSLLTPLTDIILERGGTIDKYMGDSIMAFWNAPTDDAEHARHACEAAEVIAGRMAELNAKWRADAEAAGRTFTEVAIGIGVNTGDCCVGNLGSDRRFDYSAIGDNVNVTSRLEGMTKMLGLTLVLGEETAKRLPDLAFIEVDLVRLKGRAAPSRVYTLLSTTQSAPETWPELKSAHEQFIAAYRAGAWDQARTQLSALRAKGAKGLEGLYQVYAQRVETMSATQVGAWDGVFVAATKQ